MTAVVTLPVPALRRPDPAGGVPAVPGTPVPGRPPADRPAVPGLLDRFGRVARDLRLSVTDRCNLRCTYCMPETGVDWLPRAGLLTTGELVRLGRIAVTALGVTAIRLTGGEPLLRPDLEDVVAGLAGLSPRPRIALTTNAVGLADRAAGLAAAGLDRVNVSLDTLDPETFRRMARRDRLADTLAGLAAADAAGLAPVKVNAVLVRGVNDAGAADLLAHCLQRGWELRFIEQMPLDAGRGWDRTAMVTAAETAALLADRFELSADDAARGSAPAERFRVRSRDGRLAGRVGIVASVTAPFCGACDRTRLTADGQLRSCLFSAGETDLRGLLRGGAPDEAVAEAWRATMWRKPAAHGVDEPADRRSGIDDPAFVQPTRPMSAIGG